MCASMCLCVPLSLSSLMQCVVCGVRCVMCVVWCAVWRVISSKHHQNNLMTSSVVHA